MRLRGVRAIRSWIRRPLERGQMIIVFAVLFVPVTVIIGVVAVDASMWQSERRGAQKDADLSALAGAYELLKPVPVAADADAKARENADLNDESGNASVVEPIVIDDSCFDGTGRLDSVKLNIRHESHLFFGAELGLPIPDIGAHARACAGSIVSRKGLRPYAVESDPTCLSTNDCAPSADTDCFVPKVVNGETVMVPRFGAWCILQDGSLDGSTSKRGLIDLNTSGSTCSDSQGNDVAPNILDGSGAVCSIGDAITAQPGAQVGIDINKGIQKLFEGDGTPPVADGADCDVEFTVPAPGTDHAGIDDFEEVAERTDGGPPEPSPDAVYALRGCKSPRVMDLVVIGNFAQDPTIKAFAGFYILGCMSDKDKKLPADVLPNKCEKGAGPGGQLQLWGIFFQKLESGGDVGEFNEYGDNAITLTE